MYSRKFNGISSIPPDYSGIALRRNEEQDSEIKAEDCYGTYPKYPVYEQDKSTYINTQKCFLSKENDCTKETDNNKIYNAIKSFSLEDILLAGLILLLLNEDEKDTGLLLILGFILLVGLK